MLKNNITRLLEQHQIPFDLFELPAQKLGAQKTAELLGVPPELVFKTIVIKREGRGKPILAVIPGSAEVDLKLLAKAVGEKKVLLTTQKEAEALTQLQAGGISPLALINKGFEVIVEEYAQVYDLIHVSGGRRGLNIRLPLADFARLTAAQFAEISK